MAQDISGVRRLINSARRRFGTGRITAWSARSRGFAEWPRKRHGSKQVGKRN